MSSASSYAPGVSDDGDTQCVYDLVPLSREAPEIRLFYLFPGQKKDRLSGFLSVEQLDDNHSHYTALSYTWEGQPEVSLALQNGTSLLITANLASALRHFRQPTRGPLPIWIDAVCINQKDDEEKSRQIFFMRQIFQLACRTWIWLGAKPLPDAKGVTGLPKPSVRVGARRLPVEDFEAIVNHPWFERVWVIQEAYFSQHAKAHYGGDSFEFKELLKIKGWKLWSDPDFVENRLSVWRDLMSINQTFKRPSPFMPQSRDQVSLLRFMLVATRAFKSSVRRDKVYALLGLLEGKVDIPVNYASTHSDSMVMTHATAHILKEELCLEALRFAAHSSDPTQPSWVPDWFSLSPDQMVSESAFWIRELGNNSKSRFHPSYSGAIDPLFAIDVPMLPQTANLTAKLTLKCLILGKISACHPFKSSKGHMDSSVAQTLVEDLVMAWETLRSQLLNNQGLREAHEELQKKMSRQVSPVARSFRKKLSDVIGKDTRRASVPETGGSQSRSQSGKMPFERFPYHDAAIWDFDDYFNLRDSCDTSLDEHNSKLGDLWNLFATRTMRSLFSFFQPRTKGPGDKDYIGYHSIAPGHLDPFRALLEAKSHESLGAMFDDIPGTELSSNHRGREFSKADLPQVCYSMQQRLVGRSFFVVNGNYPGVGPAAVQDGDVLCRIKGILMPCIVRPLGNGEHLWIGEANWKSGFGLEHSNAWEWEGHPSLQSFTSPKEHTWHADTDIVLI